MPNYVSVWYCCGCRMGRDECDARRTRAKLSRQSVAIAFAKFYGANGPSDCI